MKKTTEQFIQEVQSLKMTEQEKTDMRHLLSVHTRTATVPSGIFLGTWFRRHAMASILAFIVVGIGATTVSAHRAGPEDFLYGFRVKVNNRVHAAVVVDEDKKFALELQHMEQQIFNEEVSATHELSTEVDVQKDDQDTEDDFDEMKEIEKEIIEAETDVRIDLEI